MRTLYLRLNNRIDVLLLFYYAIVGGISAIINFITFAILFDGFHVYYKIAVSISYFLAILFNFTSNRRFTFKRSGSYFACHVYRYLAMVLLNYGLTLWIVHFSVRDLNLSPYTGLAVSIALTTVIGFTLSKFWVFNK